MYKRTTGIRERAKAASADKKSQQNEKDNFCKQILCIGSGISFFFNSFFFILCHLFISYAHNANTYKHRTQQKKRKDISIYGFR